MFVSEKLVFLELHKTGSTHIRNILNELLDGELMGKHNQVSTDLSTEGRIFLGSVRNPWELYISLWAYGCDKKGMVFQNVSHSHDPQKWSNTYKDVNDAEAFRVWLYMMNDENHWADFKEGYSECVVSRTVGLITYRYLRLFCTKVGGYHNFTDLETFKQIRKYEKEYCFIDHFIRNEILENDLFRGLEMIGVNISDNTKAGIFSQKKTNTSSRKYGLSYYYDLESENLVAEREQLIVEKFGYVRPSLAQIA